jgi:predicted transcriptional regulator
VSLTMTDTTITVRVSTELRNRLEAIAKETRRSKSFLSNEAIERYVEDEEDVISGIKQAMKEMDEGKWTAHEDVVREIDEIIAEAERFQQFKNAS